MHTASMYFGFDFHTISQELEEKDLLDVRERCKTFLCSLAEQIQKRLPDNLSLLKTIADLHPRVATSQVKPDIKPILNYIQRTHIYGKKTDIESEWQQLSNKIWTNTSSSADFYFEVYDDCDAAGCKRFENISKFGLAFATVPISNASVERAFSLYNVIKNKQKSSPEALTPIYPYGNEVRDFEERPLPPRGPTSRSQKWRDQRKEKKTIPPKRDDAAASYDFKATDETAPVDEPLYDLGPHSSAVPVQEIYSQNYEFSGYIDQVERTYEAMRGIDPRLDRRMPFSMFQHSMTTILNCYLMDLTLENGERKIGCTRMQDLLPEDLNIPDNLYHYLTSVGNTTTVSGEEIRFNLPDVAIPQPEDGNIPAGSFGALTPENHNVYECYISPLVTMNRVLDSRRAHDQPPVPPLPAVLTPAGSVPNTNLLGYGPPDIITPEGRARIEGFEFPEGDSDAARLRVCPELMARVNTVLFEMRNRYKMRNIGRTSQIPEIT
ncbi:hypothetical protein ACJJTC_015019 [Scirpophaga incertulas]